jgi:hypothetical protein
LPAPLAYRDGAGGPCLRSACLGRRPVGQCHLWTTAPGSGSLAPRPCAATAASVARRQADGILTGDTPDAGVPECRAGRVEPPAHERPRKRLLPLTCRASGGVLAYPTRVWCDDCLPEARAEKDRAKIAVALRAKAEMRAAGNDPSHGGEVAQRRGATHREQLRLNAEWEAHNPLAMTESEYRAQVLPGLSQISVRTIAEAMGVSQGYAARVRRGEVMPHPRHWQPLARIGLGYAPEGSDPQGVLK